MVLDLYVRQTPQPRLAARPPLARRPAGGKRSEIVPAFPTRVRPAGSSRNYKLRNEQCGRKTRGDGVTPGSVAQGRFEKPARLRKYTAISSPGSPLNRKASTQK